MRTALDVCLPDRVEPPPPLVAAVDEASVLRDVPVPIRLDESDAEVIGVVAHDADALVRALVAQLAVQTGPADWRLLVMADRHARYRWADSLPHGADVALDELVGQQSDARSGSDDPRRVVVVSDRPELLTARDSELRRLLRSDVPVTVLVEIAPGVAVPAACTATIERGARGHARWTRRAGSDDAADWPSRVLAAGVSMGAMVDLARRLARFVDPESPARSGSLPLDLALTDLPGVPDDVDGVVAAWSVDRASDTLTAPIGLGRDGVVEIDLVRDGPHALVAGTTGSGKSELLRTLVVSLAATVPPERLNFVLVDYKGGAAFDACTSLPHTVGVVTDLDEGLAARALTGLEAELRRRERILRDHRVADVGLLPPSVLARLVVVIDEFAPLAAEHPSFLSSLVGVAQRGRSLGLHLVLGTQRPAGVVNDHIRANTDLRIALRLNDRADSIDVVGDPSAAGIVRAHAGRAVVRRGPGSLDEVQVARVADELVSAVITAGRDRPGPRVRRPWLPPLPEVIAPRDVESEPGDDPGDDQVTIGILDDPPGQRRLPLRWGPSSGNLALVGGRRTGTTTALVTLASTLASGRRKELVHLYVLDGRGDEQLDRIDLLPQCAGVVRVHERERLMRTVDRLADEVSCRLAGGPRATDVVVLIDGLGAVRSAIDDLSDTPVAAGRLERVLADGPGVGVVAVAVVDAGAGPGSLLGRFSNRWVLHLDDPHDGPSFGIPAARVSPRVPGRLVDVATLLDGQLAFGEVAPVTDLGDASARPRRIDRLPDEFPIDRLADVVAPPGTVLIGLDARALDPAALRLCGGDHASILGPPRSGRTTALSTVVAGWRRGNVDGAVLWLGRPDESDGLVATCAEVVESVAASSRPVLVVVDDVERVDDAGGHLAGLLDEASTRVSVVVAGRPDVLRGRFGHWTAGVRRSGIGLVSTATPDAADLLGVVVPRRTTIDPRPGLVWRCGAGEPALVQLATVQLASGPMPTGRSSETR